MADTIAYFLTWTAYGTWLPGDQRGWQQWHQGWQRPNVALEAYSTSIMKESAVLLDEEKRGNVETTIAKHCEIRNWHLWAANCRSNHVHVVVTALTANGETVRDQLKAWCTRNLKLAFNPNKKNWWAEGGYIVIIRTEDDLSSAIKYTTQAQ